MRGIDVVVMKRNMRMRPAGFTDRSSQGFAFKDVEIESRRQNENFIGGFAIDGGGKPVDGCELDIGRESQYGPASVCDQAYVALL